MQQRASSGADESSWLLVLSPLTPQASLLEDMTAAFTDRRARSKARLALRNNKMYAFGIPFEAHTAR